MSSLGNDQHRERTERLNLGLAVLSVVNRSGTPLGWCDIAEICQVKESAIRDIANRAFRKLRRNPMLKEYL